MQLYCIIIVISSRPHTLSPTLFPYTTLFRSPTEPSFGTDLAGHARDFRGKRRELVHHRVDGVLELEDLALDVHRRSEEHTSELQSPDHLVSRLLLEKKKTTSRL